MTKVLSWEGIENCLSYIYSGFGEPKWNKNGITFSCDSDVNMAHVNRLNLNHLSRVAQDCREEALRTQGALNFAKEMLSEYMPPPEEYEWDEAVDDDSGMDNNTPWVGGSEDSEDD